MTLRFERIVAFGPVVNYNDENTWTPEVRRLYQRLEKGDSTALAPLLAIDLEFITDPKAIVALIMLKYDPGYPAQKARAELRKIANVIQRRPGPRRAKLPPGDVLLAETQMLASWIDNQRLLQLKKDPAALGRRIAKILDPPEAPTQETAARVEVGWVNDDGTYIPSPVHHDPPPRLPRAQQKAIRDALVEEVRSGSGYVRSSRSWALQVLGRLHGVKRKQIEKRIARDPIARAMRPQAKAPSRRPKKSR